MQEQIHDFYGPYQIHKTHDGHSLVFVKGVYEAFDFDSKRLKVIVEKKISELENEYIKWNSLLGKISDA